MKAQLLALHSSGIITFSNSISIWIALNYKPPPPTKKPPLTEVYCNRDSPHRVHGARTDQKHRICFNVKGEKRPITFHLQQQQLEASHLLTAEEKKQKNGGF